MRRTFALCAFVLAALCARAEARSTIDLRADQIDFFADAPALVAHDRVVMQIDDVRIAADYAYVDVAHDRAVFGGDVVLAAGTARQYATLAVDLDARSATGITGEARVVALDRLAVPVERTLEALPASDAFAVIAFDDRAPYIRSRHITLVRHANLRLTPASFPSSPLAPPAPTFLYSLAANPNLTTSTLPAATFDQPLNLAGGEHALLAAHVRYLDGVGGTVGFDEHLVDGDRAYAVGAIDAPGRTAQALSFSGYQRMSDRLTQSLDATHAYGISSEHYAFNAEIARLFGRFDLVQSGASGSLEASLRTRDRPLALGATYRLRGAYGLDHNPSGVLDRTADPLVYKQLFRTSLEADIASPLLRGPFGTNANATLSETHAWYAYPHQRDALGATLTVSKKFSRALFGNASVSTNYTNSDFGAAQLRFYPPTALLLPDGSLWQGGRAYRGATTARTYNLDLYITPRSSTDVRLDLTRTNDFPQFAGYGRPITVARVDVRFRPLPNLGIALGRSDQFGWGGVTFSRWYVSVTP